MRGHGLAWANTPLTLAHPCAVQARCADVELPVGVTSLVKWPHPNP